MLVASAMQQYHFCLIDNNNTYSDSSNRSLLYSPLFFSSNNKKKNNYINSSIETISKSSNHTEEELLSFPVFYQTMKAMKTLEGAKYDCMLFDMDDTLYPMSTGLNMACRKNIEEFMLHRLGINETEVPRMCWELYKEYGTTMAGLKDLGYEFDNDEFHAYVHGRLPYEVLRPDSVLRNLLLSMPQRKIIFTNADKEHAAQVLHRLGLEDCFEGIICFETLNPSLESGLVENGSSPLESDDYMISGNINDNKISIPKEAGSKQKILCKPSVFAMEAAIQIANLDPKKTLFFDDSVRNIASAKSAGLCTVIVGSSDLVPGADYALRSIHNMKEAVPDIWEGIEGEEHIEQIIQSTVETVHVLA